MSQNSYGYFFALGGFVFYGILQVMKRHYWLYTIWQLCCTMQRSKTRLNTTFCDSVLEMYYETRKQWNHLYGYMFEFKSILKLADA